MRHFAFRMISLLFKGRTLTTTLTAEVSFMLSDDAGVALSLFT